MPRPPARGGCHTAYAQRQVTAFQYSAVIVSDEPVMAQYTRRDSRSAELALLSTIAVPVE